MELLNQRIFVFSFLGSATCCLQRLCQDAVPSSFWVLLDPSSGSYKTLILAVCQKLWTNFSFCFPLNDTECLSCIFSINLSDFSPRWWYYWFGNTPCYRSLLFVIAVADIFLFYGVFFPAAFFSFGWVFWRYQFLLFLAPGFWVIIRKACPTWKLFLEVLLWYFQMELSFLRHNYTSSAVLTWSVQFRELWQPAHLVASTVTDMWGAQLFGPRCCSAHHRSSLMPFVECRTSGIRKNRFLDLASLSTVVSESHTSCARVCSSFLFIAELSWVCHCCHLCVSPPVIDRHLGCFLFGALMNEAAWSLYVFRSLFVDLYLHFF